MVLAHAQGSGQSGWLAYLPLGLVVLAGLVHLALSAYARTRQGWPVGRVLVFSAGMVVLGWALSPNFDARADHDFSFHAAQHLLISMVAPVLLVLGLPVTLLLRALGHTAAVRLVALLRSGPFRVLSSVWTALLLNSGGLVVLYFTPLYELSTRSGVVHTLVHVHLVLSGFLFAWAVLSLEAAPHRPRVRTRLLALGVSIAVHAAVSQLLYAGLLVQVWEPTVERQAGGALMYFGGDVAVLLLAAALLVTARVPAPSPDRAAAPVRPARTP